MNSQRSEATEQRSLAIVIVDAVTESRELLVTILTELEYENVLAVAEKSEVVPVLSERRVDLLLLNWTILGGSGIELLKTIRQDEQLASLPVIVTARTEDRENLVEAICAGASSLLVLDGDSSVLRETLRLRLEAVFNVDPFAARVSHSRF